VRFLRRYCPYLVLLLVAASLLLWWRHPLISLAIAGALVGLAIAMIEERRGS
jgi:hypothetical protein